jgi:hypothetical protein
MMKAIDTTLILQSVHDNITQWGDLNKLPSKTSFRTHFNAREDAFNSGDPRKSLFIPN